jgi:transaldolase/transaldolase/glucose-6-phosphate isomerase
MNRLQTLRDHGQAIWLDYIRRDLLTDGSLAAMVRDDGVTGVTSNPAIFKQAIGESTLYDAALAASLEADPEASVVSLYEELAVQDIRRAADILAEVHRRTEGVDGYVSLEVSPHLARDTESTIAEARRLWDWVDRPNLMIKVPATAEGIPAIENLVAAAVNVNVTLMFSMAHYEAVAQAYLRGVERTAAPERVASVASFFVSRVDSKIDPLLAADGSEAARALEGSIGIANSKAVYRRYGQLFEGDGFAPLADRGARPQRVLWASTSTKNPAYRDVLYVEELIGPNTVNTIPPDTLDAFRDHGEARGSLLEDVAEAQRQLADLARLGLDLDALTEELQEEGVAKFVQPFDTLLATLTAKREELLAE